MKLIKDKIKGIIYDGHFELSKYYAVNFISTLNYFTSKFFDNCSLEVHLNFLITSRAELRLFKPILLEILNIKSFKASIFYLGEFKFNDDLEDKILQSKTINISNSIFPVIKSFKFKNYINIICLDHFSHYRQHWLGVDIVKYIRRQGGKTVCLQHGGSQQDNIDGHESSESQFQIVFGRYIYSKLIDSGLERDRIFLTGNPMHDWIITEQCRTNNKAYLNHNFDVSKKIITLITCLHAEYDDRGNSQRCYEDYIMKIYKSIDFSKYHLIVKMHPNDSVEPNIYKNQLVQFKNSYNNIFIVKPDNSVSVYDYISISDLIISRSSTIMEESLCLKKKIISFDLFKDGPSNYYNHLNKYSSYKTVIGFNSNLENEIEDSVINVNFNDEEHNEIIKDFAYRLDNGSVSRILDVFQLISER